MYVGMVVGKLLQTGYENPVEELTSAKEVAESNATAPGSAETKAPPASVRCTSSIPSGGRAPTIHPEGTAWLGNPVFSVVARDAPPNAPAWMCARA